MTPTMKRMGIDRLSEAERLELIGEIWDSLSQTDEENPMPEWHIRELERRRAAADADPTASIPWDKLKTRLSERP